MTFSIILIGAAQNVYLLYVLYTLHVFDKLANKEELLAFLAGLSMIGLILSAEAIFLNYARIGEKKNKVYIVGFVLAIIATILFFTYLVFRYVMRIHEVGATVF